MATPRRLPVDLAVRRSYQYAWESRGVFARPYAVYVCVTIVVELLLLAVAGNRSRAADFVIEGLEELFALSFAVGIHRFVLLGEATSGLGWFRLDRHFVQYVLLSAVIFILGIIVAMPGFMAMGAPTAGDGMAAQGPAAMISAALVIVAAIAICRLMLMLPASAIGDALPARAIWQAGRGNGFRLFATMLLTVMPFLIVESILIQFVPSTPAGSTGPAAVTLGEVVVAVVACLVTPAQTIVCTIMLSLCYDALVRGGGPPPR